MFRIAQGNYADFNSNTDFWAIVAAKVGLPYKGELTTEREVNEGNSKETDSKSEKYVLAKDTVIQYYKEHDKVLVIDDFHYASKEMQTKMAQQLKDAIRRELKGGVWMYTVGGVLLLGAAAFIAVKSRKHKSEK